jgi:hypothetical protein
LDHELIKKNAILKRNWKNDLFNQSIFSDISEENAMTTAQRVRDVCQSLSAKLTLPAVEDLKMVDTKYALFVEQFRKLQIIDAPISYVIPPQIANLIGYRSMMLDLEKLKEQKLDTYERAEEFCQKNLDVWVLMNQNTQSSKKNSKGICQNLHLVPGDSVVPTVTIHLHKSHCEGNFCNKNESEGEQLDAINVFGGYQEFYFMKRNENKPCFKLCFQKGVPPAPDPTSGIVLHLEEKETPIPVVELDDECDEDRISPEEAFRLWKSRFVALFMSPAVLHFYR